MKFTFMGHLLTINNKTSILPNPIIGVISLGNTLLVITLPQNLENENLLKSNIFAFNENGEQIWEVEKPKKRGDREVPFADIGLRKNGQIVAGTIYGHEYIVNLEDGSINPKGGRPW